MFTFRTDLASELRTHAMRTYAEENRGEPDGVVCRERNLGGGITENRIEITSKEGENAIGKPMGTYLTLFFPPAASLDYETAGTLTRLLSERIKTLCGETAPKAGRVLFCGLGNREITPDALGSAAADRVLATHHLLISDPETFAAVGFSDMAVFAPGVMAQTGMEAQELVAATVEKLRPDVVIAVDALCARDPERLFRTVQISTTGIAPGSGIGNLRGALNRETLGVPVLGLGVPTVIESATMVRDALADRPEEERQKAAEKLAGLFVSPKDADLSVRLLSSVVGDAVNTAFQEGLSAEEMAMM